MLNTAVRGDTGKKKSSGGGGGVLVDMGNKCCTKAGRSSNRRRKQKQEITNVALAVAVTTDSVRIFSSGNYVRALNIS